MAVFSVDYYSNCLRRFTSFKAVLPNDLPPELVGDNPCCKRPTKSLYLLHGYSGINTDWLYNTPISELSNKYNLAVICPSGENSFYLDGPETGRQYGRFVGEELPDYVSRVFSLSQRREDVFIGGFSMGGYGALHTALAYPERFSKVLSFSAALIQHAVESITPGMDDGTANYDYYRLMFGPLNELSRSPNSPEFLVERLQESGTPLPGIFLCVGTEDFLYENNQRFRQFLSRRGVDFQYREGPGTHDFHFVSSLLEQALQYLTEDA